MGKVPNTTDGFIANIWLGTIGQDWEAIWVKRPQLIFREWKHTESFILCIVCFACHSWFQHKHRLDAQEALNVLDFSRKKLYKKAAGICISDWISACMFCILNKSIVVHYNDLLMIILIIMIVVQKHFYNKQKLHMQWKWC